MTRKENNLLDTLNTVAAIMNFVVAAVITFETVVRFSSFLREWRPANRKRMGFCRDLKQEKTR